MIDLINRLRDQREELKLKRFKEGGGQTDEGVVDYTLAPGLSGYTPPVKPLSLSIAPPNDLLKSVNNDKIYKPGSFEEKYTKDSQNALNTSSENAYIGGSGTAMNQAVKDEKRNKDRNSLLTSLLASQGTSSLEGSLFGLGRGIGAKAGTPGKGAAIVGNAGALLFGGARSLMSGVAASKSYDRNQAWTRDVLNQSQNVYNNATQFQNANTTGGTAQGRYGGILGYEDGGNTTFDSQPTDEQTTQYKQIAQKLSDKYPTIEALDQYLQSADVPDEAYQGILDEAQQIYGVDQQQQQQDVANLDELNTQSASYREGGETQGPKAPFNKKVGDEIHFQYGGKTHKGTISKIENGKIYL